MENQKRKILIIDDDRFLLNMYSIKFKSFGFEVDTAGGGQEALNKLRDGATPNILLMDVVMPSMDGIELLEKIRKEKFVPEATIIVLSNQNQPADIERAKNLGISSYIVKANMIPSEVVKEIIKVIKV